MIVYIRKEIDESSCNALEIAGEDFVVTPEGLIFHRRSGSPWELNGKYNNPRRSVKRLRLSYEGASLLKRKKTINFLKSLPAVND